MPAKKYGLAAGASLLALVCGAAMPVCAQTAAGAEDVAAKQGVALEEIVVTARRREESLQDVPVSVTVLSGDQLASAGVADVIDLQSQTPSLTIIGSGGNRSEVAFSMRGQTRAFGGAFPGVASYFADVPILEQANTSFLDLEGVQVLKGPQGTLFGRNTTGGAVLFSPTRPGREFGGYASARLGNYNLREFQGAVNVPVVPDVLAVRVAAQSMRRDGFTINLRDGQDLDDVTLYNYRVGVLFTPGERFKDYLVVDGYQGHDHGGGFALTNVRAGSPAALAYPTIFQYLQTQRARGPRVTELDGAPFAKRRGWTIVNTAEFKLSDNLSVKDILGYQRVDSNLRTDQDGSPFFVIQYPKETHKKVVTNELQLLGQSFDNNLDWVAGLYYEHLTPTGVSATRAFTFGRPAGTLSDQRVESSTAVFAQGTYDLGALLPGLKFTAGGRYTWDQRQIDPLNGTGLLRVKFDAPTYTLGLDYHPTPDVLLYVTTRRGYKSGGLNTVPPTPDLATFQPETLTDYEAGVKVNWRLGEVLGRTNASAYYSNYNDIQRSVSILLPGGRVSAAAINAAKGSVRGFDIETNIAPTSWFNVSAFYSLTDASYDSFPTIRGDASSSEFGFTPKHKVGATFEFSAPLPDNYGDLQLRLNYYYQSHFYAWDLNFENQESLVKPYGLVNVNLDWSDIGGKPVTASVFVTNAFDRTYVQQSNPLATGVGTTSVGYGEPRMYGAGLRYKF